MIVVIIDMYGQVNHLIREKGVAYFYLIVYFSNNQIEMNKPKRLQMKKMNVSRFFIIAILIIAFMQWTVNSISTQEKKPKGFKADVMEDLKSVPTLSL